MVSIDPEKRLATVEGMTTYAELVRATLAFNLLPCVIPELKTITVGGAISGLGIESSSFRFGLAHESVEEMEVVTAGGSVLNCSRERNQDLFYALPNSYGTLGYIVRATLRLIPALRYVELKHAAYCNSGVFFRGVEAAIADGTNDFVDGMVVNGTHMYLTTGKMLTEAPWASNYRYMKVYYKSVLSRTSDYLYTDDYVWRWDTDWFWCSKQFGVQHPLVRLLATPWLLNSKTYQKVMRLSHRVLPDSGQTESVIQDVATPLTNAETFLEFLLSEIPIRPIWICPFVIPEHSDRYVLYPLRPGTYVNFGFWDVLPVKSGPGWYNRRIEEVAGKLDGRKALYSSSYYDESSFKNLFRYSEYETLKDRYDPNSLFGSLYDKCVLRQ